MGAAGARAQRKAPGSAARPVYFKTPAELRQWFEQNHEGASELWVGYHRRGTGRPSVTWSESVDQALCFGWIDGVRKSLGAEHYTIRFSRRRPNSIWSNVNVAKVKGLEARGLMRRAGREAFARRKAARSGVYSFEQRKQAKLQPRHQRLLKANPRAWSFFQAQPPGYQRTATFWVVSAIKQETRDRRLATLISDSAAGRRIGLLAR